MKLDRNINPDGRGKYALVRLRDIEEGTEAHAILLHLVELGHLDWGFPQQPDEFFVIKLRDKYAFHALSAYADAVREAAVHSNDVEKRQSLMEYSFQVSKLCARAGRLSKFCKEPD